MDSKLIEWRKSNKHLPEFLKDFHDQKDFFKFLDEFCGLSDHELLKDVDFVKGQVYTLDVLLWVLARFGWTLQRSRSRQDFDDLAKFMSDFEARRNEQMAELFNEQMAGLLKGIVPSQNKPHP